MMMWQIQDAFAVSVAADFFNSGNIKMKTGLGRLISWIISNGQKTWMIADTDPQMFRFKLNYEKNRRLQSSGGLTGF